MTDLYLIRHGRSKANLNNLVTGDVYDPLLLESEAEISATMDRINVPIFDKYITTTWKRAKDTAGIIDPNVDWFIEKSLGETDAGSVANNNLKYFLSEYPNFYLDASNRYPDGESHLCLKKRVVKWAKELAPSSKKFLIVTHSGPINILLHEAEDISMDKFPNYRLDNFSVSLIKIKSGRWFVKFINKSMQDIWNN